MKLRFCPTCFVFPSILTWQPVWATISGLQLFVVPAVTGGGPSAPGWGPSSSAAAGGLAVEGGLQLLVQGLHQQQQLGAFISSSSFGSGTTIVWPQQTVRSSCWSSHRMGISLQPTHKRFNSAYPQFSSNTLGLDETFSC